MRLKQLFSLFLLAALCVLPTYAAEPEEETHVGDPDVSISAAEPVYAGSNAAVSVETVFYDLALYHENVFLSYHVLGMDGELLLFENQRLPLAPDETGTAKNEILIDFAGIPELEKFPQVQIQFDLVDQKNVFWFASNAEIELQTNLLCILHTYAAEPEESVPATNPDVSISAAKPVYTSSGVSVSVETVFHDPDLYHEEVFLSCHVFDMEGELLLFENQRLPLAPDETGTAKNELQIDFVNTPELENVPQAQVQFDLVDQKNMFWFASNSEIEFQTDSVLFDRMDMATTEEDPVAQDVYRPEVFSVGICILGWAILVFGAWWVHRKSLKIQ